MLAWVSGNLSTAGPGRKPAPPGHPDCKDAKLDRRLRLLRDILYPPECLLCGSRHQLRPGFDACYGCLADLPRLENACERCAESLVSTPGTAVLCGACLAHPPPFQRSRCLGRYTGSLAALVRGLKYQRRLENGRLLGRLLGRYIAASVGRQPLLLMPVPLHHAQLRRRGFNQAGEICRWAARESGLATMTNAVQRRRNTATQTGLGARARRTNLAGAFACGRRLDGLRVGLVDDVMTTGSTAACVAEALLGAGCASVEIWCCARASLQHDGPERDRRAV